MIFVTKAGRVESYSSDDGIRSRGVYWTNTNNIIHRENHPASINCYGIFYIVNGKWHREDGPAVVYTNGYKHWFRNGVLHRDDGPAITYSDGTKHFYLEGKPYTEKNYYKVEPE